MSATRVAVTGLGVICALGRNREETWTSLAAGRSGIGPLASVDASKLRFRNGAEVRGYDSNEHFEGNKAGLLDRFAQFALVAAREALRDCGIDAAQDRCAEAAVVTGSSLGGQSSQDAGFVDLYMAGRDRVHPLTIPRTMANAGASHISMEFGFMGPALTVSTACSSANHALGLAFRMVRNGEAPFAIAGGSEAPFSMGLLKAWEAMRVISPDTCRPFCADRRGMILGEGAAMLALEPLEAARARGARIYAEVAGFGMSSDAHHITQPSLEGPLRAMRGALRDAGVAPEQVGYVNAHGTGTAGNDVVEARAIREVFGGHAAHVAVSSTKSMHGHALGAAGALEAVATVLALRHGLLPPTANFTSLDPECEINVVANQARPAGVEYALSNSFAFGGLNAALLFRAFANG
ncbi:MAG: beta-ketoacyl-[acyl-carrier-protein] synthase family protein [Bryobacteraceae bacterium]|nr:beta-ketoacyl-[acyl-carrier-protein] synthase family protein [Bryobacteraceae bacterium]